MKTIIQHPTLNHIGGRMVKIRCTGFLTKKTVMGFQDIELEKITWGMFTNVATYIAFYKSEKYLNI